MPPSQSNSSEPKYPTSYTTPDVAIIGGGIVGLWCANHAAKLGLRAVLFEKGAIGQGASGGFLGALMPHQPVGWIDEKAFQLDALLTLESEINLVQQITGIDCGYRRCGRLIPTRTEEKRAERTDWRSAANQNWPAVSPQGASLDWNLLEDVPDPNWLNPEIAMLGCEHETLSARLDPRGLLTALTSAIRNDVEICEHASVRCIDPGNGSLTLSDGTKLTPGNTILAAGHGSFDLLKPLTSRQLGRGVKGQAALLNPLKPIDTEAPILYYAGLYVIAHDNGLVAVGSTSENKFIDPVSTDQKLGDLIARATELCPAIIGAEVVERWSGIRPNAVGRHPMIGPLPETPNVIVCTGGFKISFAIAHKMAEAALTFVNGTKPWLPECFEIASHYARSNK